MKLVIRAEAPLALRHLVAPLRRLGVLEHRDDTALGRGEALLGQVRSLRAFCPSVRWEEEEEALLQLVGVASKDSPPFELLVQPLPVPAGLPLPLLELMTGWELTEKREWGVETFSPLAMAWLREAGAKPLARLEGRLQRIEKGEGLAVLVLEDGEAQGISVAREQRNHAEEHIDEGMLLLQANLDDSSPEWLAYVMELCLRAGANDVHFLPVTMKKSRPGTLLQVMCYQSEAEALKTLLFTETTTFGIRSFPVACHRLARRFVTVATEWGEVTVKLGFHREKRVQVAPEYAACAKLAEAAGVPLRQVYQQAVQLASEKSL